MCLFLFILLTDLLYAAATVCSHLTMQSVDCGESRWCTTASEQHRCLTGWVQVLDGFIIKLLLPERCWEQKDCWSDFYTQSFKGWLHTIHKLICPWMSCEILKGDSGIFFKPGRFIYMFWCVKNSYVPKVFSPLRMLFQVSDNIREKIKCFCLSVRSSF